MSSDESDSPALRVVSGSPSAEELAVLTAVVAAAAAATAPVESPARGRWNDPFDAHRRPWLPGPGAWQAASR
ncbi:MAG: acyl-CoA carboxylase subunit epsilon [Actinomycetota bacterium]|nr:acyl-CoA carboxylase subunit epsilon [Actinomycetota bacterium]